MSLTVSVLPTLPSSKAKSATDKKTPPLVLSEGPLSEKKASFSCLDSDFNEVSNKEV